MGRNANTDFPIDPSLIAAVESVFIRVAQTPVDFIEAPSAWHKAGVQIRAEVKRNQHGRARADLDYRSKNELRFLLADRDGESCAYCGCSFPFLDSATVDHVIPYQVIGHWEPWNLVLACEPCNTHKGNRVPKAFQPVVWALLYQAAKQVYLSRDTDTAKPVQLALFDTTKNNSEHGGQA